MSPQTITKIVIFFTCFLDAFGIGLVFPLLSPLLLDPDQGFLPLLNSDSMRGALLGFVLASYSLAQFFSAPVFGMLSDYKGRRTILIRCVSIAFVGYIIAGFAIFLKSYSLLLLGRLLEGLASGSISVTYATLADISTGRSKIKNFGLLGACWSLGFILGPFAGGYLSSNKLSTFFTYATPFWFAAILAIINLLLVFFFFKETFTATTKKQIHLLQGVINLKKAWLLFPLRKMMLAMFIFFIGWEIFALFIPIFLINRFVFDSLAIGNFYAFLGAGFVIGNTFILRLVSHIPTENLLKIGLPLFAIYIFPLIYFSSLPFFLAWLSLIPIAGAVIFALGPIHISNASRADEQGEVLGIYQSVQAGALALPPLIFGSLAVLYPSFSIWGSALFSFLSGLVFWFIKGPKLPKTPINKIFP